MFFLKFFYVYWELGKNNNRVHCIWQILSLTRRNLLCPVLDWIFCNRFDLFIFFLIQLEICVFYKQENSCRGDCFGTTGILECFPDWTSSVTQKAFTWSQSMTISLSQHNQSKAINLPKIHCGFTIVCIGLIFYLPFSVSCIKD